MTPTISIVMTNNLIKGGFLSEFYVVRPEFFNPKLMPSINELSGVKIIKPLGLTKCDPVNPYKENEVCIYWLKFWAEHG